jgi:hypothetical protein
MRSHSLLLLLQDNLVMAAIRFLTTVSRSVHYTLFGAAGVLQQICEMVIVPNVRSRPEDEEVRTLPCRPDDLSFSFSRRVACYALGEPRACLHP